MMDIRTVWPNAKFVLEATKTEANGHAKADDVEAIGRDGARAYSFSDTEIAVYVPRKITKRDTDQWPGVRIHQRGETEATAVGLPDAVAVVARSFGINTRIAKR